MWLGSYVSHIEYIGYIIFHAFAHIKKGSGLQQSKTANHQLLATRQSSRTVPRLSISEFLPLNENTISFSLTGKLQFFS